jgi:cell division protein FtsN
MSSQQVSPAVVVIVLILLIAVLVMAYFLYEYSIKPPQLSVESAVPANLAPGHARSHATTTGAAATPGAGARSHPSAEKPPAATSSTSPAHATPAPSG